MNDPRDTRMTAEQIVEPEWVDAKIVAFTRDDYLPGLFVKLDNGHYLVVHACRIVTLETLKSMVHDMDAHIILAGPERKHPAPMPWSAMYGLNPQL